MCYLYYPLLSVLSHLQTFLSVDRTLQRQVSRNSCTDLEHNPNPFHVPLYPLALRKSAKYIILNCTIQTVNLCEFDTQL